MSDRQVGGAELRGAGRSLCPRSRDESATYVWITEDTPVHGDRQVVAMLVRTQLPSQDVRECNKVVAARVEDSGHGRVVAE